MRIRVTPKFVALRKFIEEKLSDALKQEENNTTHVYFHRCGKDWITIERSAYAICQRYSLNDELILIKNTNNGEHIVLLLISESIKSHMPQDVRIPIFPFCQWKQLLFVRNTKIK